MNPESQTQKTNQVTQLSSNPVIQTEQNKFIVILLSILLFIAICFAGFFAYQTQKLFAEVSGYRSLMKPESFEVVDKITTELNDSTANWKTYKNDVLKYTIKYPSDWILDKSEAELPINDQNSQKLVIYKGEYKLSILWPSAYGPGICLFDDQSREGAPEIASYCEGKYIEIKSSSGATIYRRLEIPDKYNQWEVYTFDKKYYVTVPPIRFNAPSDYDMNQILIMDKILSTYTSLN